MKTFKEMLVENNDKAKVGDSLKMGKRTGKVIKVNDDQATVDFGGGDTYGIVHRRIKDGVISEDGPSGGTKK